MRDKSDIVERLRLRCALELDEQYLCDAIECEAADEIERLRSEIARLRKNADGQIRSRVAEDIAVESAWERCGITPHWPDDEAGSVVSHAESMAMEIARLREERRWVPVGERLPHVGPDEKVLVAWRYEDEPKESLVVSEAWHLRLGLFLDKEEFEFPGVKFWMPLPPGPETKEGGNG